MHFHRILQNLQRIGYLGCYTLDKQKQADRYHFPREVDPQLLEEVGSFTFRLASEGTWRQPSGSTPRR